MKKRFLVILSFILVLTMIFALPSCKSKPSVEDTDIETEAPDTNERENNTEAPDDSDSNNDVGDNNNDDSDSSDYEDNNNDDGNGGNNDDGNGDNNDDGNGDNNDDGNGDNNDDGNGDNNDDGNGDNNDDGNGDNNDDGNGGNNDDNDEEFVDNSMPVLNGNKVTFGSYPQSEVTDSALIIELEAKAIDWERNNGKWYANVVNDGARYIGITETDSSEAVWFKYEPITWTILEEKDGKAFLLCDMIIDAKAYSSASNNNYEKSDIRAWLNADFINTAFGELQQTVILTTLVKNDAESTGYSSPRFDGENTNDKIFLLSRAEVKAYGFDSNGSVKDPARQKKATAYAIAQIDGAYDASNGAWWWLRTPAPHATDVERADLAHTIKIDGSLNNATVNSVQGGVVPAMWINI